VGILCKGIDLSGYLPFLTRGQFAKGLDRLFVNFDGVFHGL